MTERLKHTLAIHNIISQRNRIEKFVQEEGRASVIESWRNQRIKKSYVYAHARWPKVWGKLLLVESAFFSRRSRKK